MGLFDRVSRLLRANVNDMVAKAEDPEKILEQAVMDMQEDLVQLRQAVASSIANQKRTEQQYTKAMAGSLKAQLDGQAGMVDTMKKSLMQLEGKISEAKTKKDMLKSRAQAAKAQEQLQGAVGRIGTNSAMAAFERMEEKVLVQEARSQAAAELTGADLESKFAALSAGSDVDDELEAMKQQMLGGSKSTAALPEGTASPKAATPVDTVKAPMSVEDAELEALRKQIDGL
jgi:phage shock protein A